MFYFIPTTNPLWSMKIKILHWYISWVYVSTCICMIHSNTQHPKYGGMLFLTTCTFCSGIFFWATRSENYMNPPWSYTSLTACSFTIYHIRWRNREQVPRLWHSFKCPLNLHSLVTYKLDNSIRVLLTHIQPRKKWLIHMRKRESGSRMYNCLHFTP